MGDGGASEALEKKVEPPRLGFQQLFSYETLVGPGTLSFEDLQKTWRSVKCTQCSC